MTDLMDPFDFARHEEDVAAAGLVSVGVGADAARASGLPRRALADFYRSMIHDFIDGGANLTQLLTAHGPVVLYVRRRGGCLDVGTRQDFAALGWAALCDLLDLTLIPESPS
jgi:hypothetical protein